MKDSDSAIVGLGRALLVGVSAIVEGGYHDSVPDFGKLTPSHHSPSRGWGHQSPLTGGLGYHKDILF